MNYENMWNRLKSAVVEKSNDVDGVRRADYNDVLLTMSSLETEEYEKDSKARAQAYTVHQDITVRADVKDLDIGKLARESFRKITGYKVIESLEELEEEIMKVRGKTQYTSLAEKTIVVDEKVKIPQHIFYEAESHGERIARFGVDVMVPGTLGRVKGSRIIGV